MLRLETKRPEGKPGLARPPERLGKRGQELRSRSPKRNGEAAQGYSPAQAQSAQTSRTAPSLATDARAIRRMVLEQSYRAGVGHIGSALSVVDILVALYGGVLRLSPNRDPDRDRFVMSKGHAALALYSVLHLRGFISEAELNGFCADGTRLGVHPEFEQAGVDFATGSLGQGLSIGVGAALAARWQRSERRVFVLLSDAECNEGSVWEASMLASHHRLANLVVIIDSNGQQALNYTREVVDMQRLADKWRTFGWNAYNVNGHAPEELAKIIGALDTRHGSPHVLVARTTSGKGVSFMENQILWHYQPLSAEQYVQALSEVEAEP